jgi:hypothetical protein
VTTGAQIKSFYLPNPLSQHQQEGKKVRAKPGEGDFNNNRWRRRHGEWVASNPPSIHQQPQKREL